ncbi:hypothetical protein PTSG_04038 [Salpingoeca rosetta]|uniref:monodehydroascorbate reductase (NADH) n=1 Tax=Salpingoeca rosetta (strain ATCC 50818 / BSB-021) TaxID=946362 RepID=F2U7L4_SALR5|nr:uncharacterized protein PTSG_04038 [Salpingoeca rosetta]EGD83431.1 hypothetical protein PTSG_04038 [Salpingoeca rosetta]|eukprot:XP_004994935.1 hypothetical protein PTSG_04038 [Salpingoeca rosetta]
MMTRSRMPFLFRSCFRHTSAASTQPKRMLSTASHMDKFKYVVLGGGTSAGYVAKAFADKGRGKDELALISRDTAPPFERPALSKGFLNASKPARLPGFHTTVGTGGEPQDEAWYVEHGITWLGEQDVTSVDFDNHVMSTARGHSISFEKLIIATGVESSHLPADKVDDRGDILYLRSLADAERLSQAMASHRGGHALMIGGGYIGTEVTAKLIENGLQVTMVFPEDRLMNRLFSPQLAEVYAKAFADRGVSFAKGTLKSLQHDAQGNVTGAILNDGSTVQCDLVVAGIGARPDTSLFDGKLETTAGGLKVNGQLHTTAQDVYAIGDIAAFPLVLEGGKHVRQEHVQNARETARHIVDVLLAEEDGRPAPAYDYTPYFYSRCLNFNWKFYGVNEGDIMHFGVLAEGEKYGAVWVRDGQIVGTFLDNGTPDEHERFKHVARERPAVTGKGDVQRIVEGVVGQELASTLQ